MTNNLISDILFLHTASLKSRCFLFIFIISVFLLDFRLVRKLVFLYFNVNVYLKEILCLNKVTLRSLGEMVRVHEEKLSVNIMTSCLRNLARAWGVCGRIESPKPQVAGAALGSTQKRTGLAMVFRAGAFCRTPLSKRKKSVAVYTISFESLLH